MANPPSHEPGYYQAAKSQSHWIVIGIVFVATMIGGGILVGFSLSGISAGKPMPIKQTDRNILISAGFLEQLLDEYIFRTDAEQLTKVRYVNEQVELQYTYEGTDNGFVRCAIIVAPDEDMSLANYRDERKQLENAAEDLSGAFTVQARNDLMKKRGDRSHYVLASDGSRIGGIFFVCQMGQKVFVFQYQGITLENQDFVVELIEPSLEQLDLYQP